MIIVNFINENGKHHIALTEYQLAKLKREWKKNMNHCDIADRSLEDFIGCVMNDAAEAGYYPTKNRTRRTAGVWYIA